jgi:hypothetical protein
MMGEDVKGNRRSKQVSHIAAWMVLLTVVLAVYHLFSDGDFSFLMTLGALCSAFGFCMLVVKCLSSQSAAGISLKSLQVYALVFFFRFISIIVHEGYLPFDKSGDWVYQAVEFTSLLMCIICIVLVTGKYAKTYRTDMDGFGNMPPVPQAAGVVYLIVPSLLLALLVHPNLNGVWWSDVSWTFALYMEAVAFLPQLYMFQKAGGVVESWTSHYVFSLGFARALHLWFWLSSHHELGDKNTGAYVGYFVVAAQVIQMILMGDFFYFYVKSLQKGTPMMLPTTHANLNNV